MPRGQDVPRPPVDTREWLLTDGAGGSALGIAAGVATHRHHALLHAPGPAGVTTLLLGFDERLLVERDTFVWFASGEQADSEAARPGEVEAFEVHPWPRWRIRCGGVTLEKSLFMPDGHHAVAVTWRHDGGPSGRLRLGPLIVARPPDGLQRETPAMRGVQRGIPGRVHLETLEGQPGLTLWYSGTFLPIRQWRRGIRYPSEPATRPASLEDAFIPGFIDCRIAPGESVHVVAAGDEALFRTLAVEGRLGTPPPSTLAECVRLLEQREVARQRLFNSAAARGAAETAREAAAARRQDVTLRLPGFPGMAEDPWTERLASALSRGVVTRGGRPALLDGFPAATESVTRALRTLPAWIAIRSFDFSRAVLRGYLEYLDDGLVPESFDAAGRPRYGDPAPSLWLVYAAELLIRRSEDTDWALRVVPGLESILHFYRNGSPHGPRVDRDGLLAVRHGEREEKPAVLNALWYHALVAMAQLARFTGRKEAGAFYLAWARQHGQSFNDQLWDEERGCLFEAATQDGPRAGFSLDQLIALSLTPSILVPERATRLLDRLDLELDPPWGSGPASGRGVEIETLAAFYSVLLRVRGRHASTFDRIRTGLEELDRRLAARTLDVVPGVLPPGADRSAQSSGRTQPAAIAHESGISAGAAAELLRLWIEDVDHATEPAVLA